MAKVVIDCRYLKMSGIGRFLENILDNLDFSKHTYTLIGKEEYLKKYQGVTYLIDDRSPFSKSSLFKSPVDLINQNDVYFVPNFIIPYGIKIKVIAVFHDILFFDHKEVNASYSDYLIKKVLINRCMKKAYKIFTISNFSLKRIAFYYPKYAYKLSYNYQGVAQIFKNQKPYYQKENYLVYVGNIKKHKGLKILLQAFLEIRKISSLKLYIIGDYESFKNKDQEMVNLLNTEGIVFTNRIDDDKLIEIVKKAKFLIQPSFYEGFGIPPLEALYLHTRPIISNIEVFKEVYKDLPVVFFKVGDYLDLKEKILTSEVNFEFDELKTNKIFSYENFSSIIEREFK